MKISDVEICENEWSKARGLMFSKKKNLLFFFDKPQRVTFHNFFVFFPIDLIFLDEEMRVVEIKEDFKPFRIYKPKNKAKYVLELCDKHRVKKGEKVYIKNKK